MTEKTKPEFISGIVERLTYHNEENGYAIIKAKVRKQKDLITIAGSTPSISVGESIQAQGVWQNNLKYGLQFKADFIRSIPPSSIEGIEKYLGSGLIKGIGPFFAKRLVAIFKEDVFDVIENTPEKLTDVEGIGKVRATTISSNWAEQKIVREIMIFLQSHGVGVSRATRIFKTYGENSIKIVSENPYQLARDIRGIGFLSADKIASNLGIESTSMLRARAGINYTLTEALNSGHCGLPIALLLENAVKLLDIFPDILKEALTLELQEGFLVQDMIRDTKSVFLKPFHVYEQYIAQKLTALSSNEPIWKNIDTERAIPWVEGKLSIALADNQKEAIRTVISSKVTIITGGPGTGKTTLLGSVLKILLAKQLTIKLAAPTGRAAKRLSETTKLNAVTIHRLLKYDPASNSFTYNPDKPLNCDLLIIDESSMVDTQLMYNLLRALPNNAGLILVGDIDQLPSVGPGQILKDAIESRALPAIRLTKIFRQGENSQIITNAHLVNKGYFPKVDNKLKDTDFFFIESNTPEEIINNTLKLVKNAIPRRFNLNPIRDIQVLSPMQRGSCGCRSLNIELQKTLTPLPSSQGLERFGQRFSQGDKVMQMVNNYDKDVYNGDIGFIKRIDTQEHEIAISFDGKSVVYSFDELDELSIAYAVTIHKSQGSEYPAVIIPISTQHFPMLQKNLLYTAITRGKRFVFLVGQKKAVAIAVKNDKESWRYSRLRELL
jgi:exodeoxyribonuclease V alpha subunit